MSKKHKHQWQVASWALFLGLSLVIGLKIIEISAVERMKIIVLNPDVAQYSTLVNGIF
jgi:hypothetical protein